MKTITVDELKQVIDSNRKAALLDVRTSMEHAEVHIANVRNVPLDSVRPTELVSEFDLTAGQPLYIVCRSGTRAAKAAEQFARAGFNNAIVVEGGTQAWVERGYPVECGQAKAISLERQVRIVAGSLVLIGSILGWQVHPGFYGLSAFVGGGLVFAGITDFCGMGLLLARMPWNQVR